MRKANLDMTLKNCNGMPQASLRVEGEIRNVRLVV